MIDWLTPVALDLERLDCSSTKLFYIPKLVNLFFYLLFVFHSLYEIRLAIADDLLCNYILVQICICDSIFYQDSSFFKSQPGAFQNLLYYLLI